MYCSSIVASDQIAVYCRRPILKVDWRKGEGRKVSGLLAIGWCGSDISGKRRGRDSLCRTRRTILVKISFPCI